MCNSLERQAHKASTFRPVSLRMNVTLPSGMVADERALQSLPHPANPALRLGRCGKPELADARRRLLGVVGALKFPQALLHLRNEPHSSVCFAKYVSSLCKELRCEKTQKRPGKKTKRLDLQKTGWGNDRPSPSQPPTQLHPK